MKVTIVQIESDGNPESLALLAETLGGVLDRPPTPVTLGPSTDVDIESQMPTLDPLPKKANPVSSGVKKYIVILHQHGTLTTDQLAQKSQRSPRHVQRILGQNPQLFTKNKHLWSITSNAQELMKPTATSSTIN